MSLETALDNWFSRKESLDHLWSRLLQARMHLDKKQKAFFRQLLKQEPKQVSEKKATTIANAILHEKYDFKSNMDELLNVVMSCCRPLTLMQQQLICHGIKNLEITYSKAFLGFIVEAMAIQYNIKLLGGTKPLLDKNIRVAKGYLRQSVDQVQSAGFRFIIFDCKGKRTTEDRIWNKKIFVHRYEDLRELAIHYVEQYGHLPMFAQMVLKKFRANAIVANSEILLNVHPEKGK